MSYDWRCYFISMVKGFLFISRHAERSNVLYINKTSDPRIPPSNIKSVSKESGFSHPRFNLVSLKVRADIKT